jgi:hypothetical protein
MGGKMKDFTIKRDRDGTGVLLDLFTIAIIIAAGVGIVCVGNVLADLTTPYIQGLLNG